MSHFSECDTELNTFLHIFKERGLYLNFTHGPSGFESTQSRLHERKNETKLIQTLWSFYFWPWLSYYDALQFVAVREFEYQCEALFRPIRSVEYIKRYHWSLPDLKVFRDRVFVHRVNFPATFSPPDPPSSLCCLYTLTHFLYQRFNTHTVETNSFLHSKWWVTITEL